ncbi:MAG: hypothetical protein LBG80_11115, partial [Bacteroidales bacterium]|nr:hypothetical protein [Bacteroidales bacterium]
MKKYISIAVGILMSIHLVYSQKITLMENFDGDTISSISSPANAWNKDSNYYVSGTYSYRGKVPHVVGDSIILTTQVYDFSNYNYVLLRFSHICKVSPQDIVRIEYRLNNMRWQVLPASAYFGNALLYQTKGFSANSYTDWHAEDSLSSPLQSWWKEEIFDVGSLVIMDNGVQFRFILKHGNTPGTQISYGWLIDNVEIIASTSEISLPVVEFLTPLVKDTVYNTDAWEINVRLKSPSDIQIENPWLVYTANNSQGTVTDSILMTSVKGDSLWRASIPQLTAGTTVQYAVTGRDIAGYYTTIQSNYIIVRPDDAGNMSVSVNLASIDMTDTVLVSPSSKIPIVATIRNSGVLNLDSVRISYSVNNVVAGSKSVYFNPALPWDFILKDTLGNYSPKSNGKDTVTVWVSMPNGQQDAVTNDDTLRKIIYGSSDIIMYFKDAPADTVYNTGPFDITAEIYTLSGNTIGTVALDLTCIFQGDTTGETLQMSNTSGNLWKTTVPKKIAGQKIIYSIEQTDALGNHAVVINSYFIKNINTNANSVSLTAIDIPDTIFVSPDSIIPVVFSIQNRGILDLDSVKVSYAVNGFTSTEKNIHIKPALAWDFMFTDTIGYYTPKVNGYDTVTVLIRMPNGQQDAVANDDSLRKIIYGSSDIMMRFIEYPDDTVYNTGPYDVTAEIYSYSAVPLGQISLLLTSSFNGNTTFDTLPLLRSSGNLWKTTIPRKAFGSDVKYAIKRTDILGNHLVIENTYYIQRLPEDTVAEVIIGTGTTSAENAPMFLYYYYGFSRQLYLGTELAQDAEGVTITQLGWYYSGTTTVNASNQYCYFQVVDDTVVNSSAYIDPVANGATLVWDGNISTVPGWMKFTLKEPFVLPPGKNLLIYWNHQSGNSELDFFTSAPWRYTNTSFTSMARGMSNTTFALATTSSLTLSYARPNAWFYVIPKPRDSNSVAIVEINSPVDNKGIFVDGTATPVQVTILNKGIPDMDSCIIEWSLNGQIQSPTTVYRGALAEALTDTITIGSYFPTAGKWDTIVAWVSMPNGVVDSTVKDDTLKITVFGCSSILSDTITIGAGEDFTSVNAVLDNMRYCGTSGDITLLLKGTFHENMDLSDLPIEGSLTITSADNHADSAIIKPITGTGI